MPGENLPRGWIEMQHKDGTFYINTLDGTRQNDLPTENAYIRDTKVALYNSFYDLILGGRNNGREIILNFKKPIVVENNGLKEIHKGVKVFNITNHKYQGYNKDALNPSTGAKFLDGSKGILHCVSLLNSAPYYHRLVDEWPFNETEASIIKMAQEKVWTDLSNYQLGGYRKSKKKKSKRTKKSKKKKSKTRRRRR